MRVSRGPLMTIHRATDMGSLRDPVQCDMISSAGSGAMGFLRDPMQYDPAQCDTIPTEFNTFNGSLSPSFPAILETIHAARADTSRPPL